MSNADNFYVFCAEFVKLAGQAELPISQWKYELNRRLTIQLRLQVMRDYLTKIVTFEVFKQICSAFYQQFAEVARRDANARISRFSKTPKITNQESSRSSTKEQPTSSDSIITSRQFSEPSDQQLKRDFPRLTTSAKATPQPTFDANKCYICGNKGHYAP
jgi:hypothetical protein